LRSWKPRAIGKKLRPQFAQKQLMHQSHTEFTSPSMLQPPVGMENFPVCKTVVQTSEPQGPDVLSDSYEAWI